MILNRSWLGRELLRLALAAVLVVTAMAGARMQGEMGALALAFGGQTGALCSGHPAPVTQEEGDGAVSRGHCVLCLLPLADCAPAPGLMRTAALWLVPAYAGPVVSAPRSVPTDHPARGPPLFG